MIPLNNPNEYKGLENVKLSDFIIIAGATFIIVGCVLLALGYIFKKCGVD